MAVKKNTLVIVGTGIKFLSHLTHETKVHIKHADKILYLVNEPAIGEWIQNSHANAESLCRLYTKHFRRIDCYKEISERILSELENHKLLCVILYGHPTVFAMPALEAALQASHLGYEVITLPAISAEDCLFADLLINPGYCGCQSYETTDFLIKNKFIDKTAHLILWQVGTIGAISRPIRHNNDKGINALIKKLGYYYAPCHPAIIYEASQYPHFRPRIDKTSIEALSNAYLTSLSTLYIPPAIKSTVDMDVLEELGLNIKDLQIE